MKEMIASTDTAITTLPLLNKTLLESTKTIISAIRLFKKCAKIGTSILSVLTYKIAIQRAKMKAEIMFPYECKEANNREDIKIAKSGGTTNFNLFRNTPRNRSSSEIGEIKTVEIKPKPIIELDTFPKIEIKLKDGNILIITSERYKNP